MVIFFHQAHAGITTIPFHNTVFEKDCCLVISHAGGSIQGFPYTNSLEALDANYALGRRVFELDFDQTKDGHWVGSHAWDNQPLSRYDRIMSLFGAAAPKPTAPTLADFSSQALHGKFTPFTLSSLATWLSQHPDATVVIDTQNVLPTLYEALDAYPTIQHHIVFQAYDQADLDFLASKHIPMSRIIFSNYQSMLNADQLIALFIREKIGALTLPASQALQDIHTLRAALPNTPIYVHGKPASINSLELQDRFAEAGVSGFYLD
jgi:glycerophosphoryl diester phosphodiesterase